MHIVREVTEATSNQGKRRYAPRMAVEERREQLMDAALEVLDRDGYAGLTVEAISRQAGVTRPVFYGAYDDLDAMLLTLLDRARDRALAQVMSLLETSGDPSGVDAWITTAAAGLIDLVQEQPMLWKPILGLTGGAPTLVGDRIQETRSVICSYLAAGIEAGLELRGGPFLDAELLARAALATAEEFGRLVLTVPESFDKERIIQGFSRTLAAVPPTRAPGPAD